MGNKYRNCYCGKVGVDLVDKEIRLAGWINSIRNLGSLEFITLRDETGIVQLYTDEVEKYSNLEEDEVI